MAPEQRASKRRPDMEPGIEKGKRERTATKKKGETLLATRKMDREMGEEEDDEV